MFLSGKTRLCVVSTHAGGVVVGGVVCVERRKEGRGAIFKMSSFAPLSNLVSFWLSSWRCPGVHRWILVPDVRCHTRHFVWRQQICHHCACRSGLPFVSMHIFSFVLVPSFAASSVAPLCSSSVAPLCSCHTCPAQFFEFHPWKFSRFFAIGRV